MSLFVTVHRAVFATVAILCSAPINAKTPDWVAIDGQTLLHQQRVHNIAGIITMPLRRLCDRPDSSGYYCGVDAREALKRLIGSRQVSCVPVVEGEIRNFICKAGGLDLGAEMVRQGHAAATLAYDVGINRWANVDYRPQQEEAKARKRGIWQGRFPYPPFARSLPTNSPIIGWPKSEPK